MKIGILIQARMGSKRLPGKMVLPLAQKPMLKQIVERLKTVRNAEVIVATGTQQADDALVRLCRQANIPVFQGDNEDVLKRFLDASKYFEIDLVIRITGDSPLIDPFVIQAMLDSFLKESYDYYSNLRPRTLPRGFGCEIFRCSLMEAALKDRKPEDIGEYVVIPYVNRHPELRLGNFSIPQDHSAIRLTLDEEADYELIRQIYDALYSKDKIFTYQEVISYLDSHPELKKLNAHVRSNNP